MLHSKTISSTLINFTAHESCYRTVPDSSEFHVFGCVVYLYKPKETRGSKLNERAELRICLETFGGLRETQIKETSLLLHTTHVRFNKHYFPAETWGRLNEDDDDIENLYEDQKIIGSPSLPLHRQMGHRIRREKNRLLGSFTITMRAHRLVRREENQIKKIHGTVQYVRRVIPVTFSKTGSLI